MGENFTHPNKNAPEIKERKRCGQKILEIGVGLQHSPFLSKNNIGRYSDAHIIRTDLYGGNIQADKIAKVGPETTEEERQALRKKAQGKIQSYYDITVTGGLTEAKLIDDTTLDLADRRGIGFTGRVDYVQCDAMGKLPFGQDTFDIIHMANVFNQPLFGLKRGDSREKAAKLILQEISRVIKKEGKIVIITALQTPKFVTPYDLVDWCRGIGLIVETIDLPTREETQEVESGDEQAKITFKTKYPYLSEYFDESLDMVGENDFALVATK